MILLTIQLFLMLSVDAMDDDWRNLGQLNS